MPPPARQSVPALVAVSVLLSASAVGQVVTPNRLTRQAAMDRAFTANPTIATTRLRGAIDTATLAEELSREIGVVPESDGHRLPGRSMTWHGPNFYASPQFAPGGGGILIAMQKARGADSSSETRTAV